ncbi:hypothetical protein [Streptomyces blattellae]|uniref:hypothetical protein n=1 Tax=Streptomyces blattellae TaxID=2569855 RepID=UPI0012B93656|nr:hypothetical protein [Streptomyces blattellae]
MPDGDIEVFEEAYQGLPVLRDLLPQVLRGVTERRLPVLLGRVAGEFRARRTARPGGR